MTTLQKSVLHERTLHHLNLLSLIVCVIHTYVNHAVGKKEKKRLCSYVHQADSRILL
jgi:hypothetical protein